MGYLARELLSTHIKVISNYYNLFNSHNVFYKDSIMLTICQII